MNRLHVADSNKPSPVMGVHEVLLPFANIEVLPVAVPDLFLHYLPDGYKNLS